MNRTKARIKVFCMLFEREFKKDVSEQELYEEMLADDPEIAGDEYIRKVFFGVVENLDSIDEKIDRNSTRWDKKRISRVAMTIMRLAVYEMENLEDVPENIAINEAIELAKTYETEKVPEFINGVLGSIVKEKEN